MFARIRVEHVSLTIPGRLVSVSLAGLAPGWCAPPPVRVLSGIHLALDGKEAGFRAARVGLREYRTRGREENREKGEAQAE